MGPRRAPKPPVRSAAPRRGRGAPRFCGRASREYVASSTAERLTCALREVQREGLQLDGEVDVLETDVPSHLQPRRREVQYRLDAGGHELIGDGLPRLRGHRD